MKAVALLAFAAGVLAQIPGLPTCAQSCVKLPQSCQTTDFKCICSDKDFISTISCCVATSCQGGDQDTVIKFANSLCGSYGVSLPSKATCASSAAATSAPSAASSSSASRASPVLTTISANGTATTATVSVTQITTTTTTASASAAPQTGAAANFAPQAGVFLGGFMAGMAAL